MKILTKTTTTMLLTTAMMMGMAIAADAAPNPYEKADRSWISIKGDVENVRPDSFLLDYGEGQVKVEMDDFKPDADGYQLVEGDHVTVYGRIDDDTFQTTTIEASSVWVEGLSTYFYANSADEEDLPPEVTLSTTDYDLKVTGKIQSIEGREFMIDTGTRAMRADTAELGYNPFDSTGVQKLEVGDRVSLTGKMDKDWWENRELMVDFIMKLQDSSSDE